MELDFDVFDADTAEDYEQAVKDVQAAAAVKLENESLANLIRRQCNSVFEFFDTLFGTGFHKEIFGEKTNLIECTQAFAEFNELVKEQKNQLNTLIQQVNPNKETLNRAARRAAAKNNEHIN